MFNAAIRETPSSNEGCKNNFSSYFPLIFFYTSEGLTALEAWCLAMIGLVFINFIAYGIILVQLNVTQNKRSWKLELSMFLILVVVTIFLVLAFVIAL